jgi:hypothetical protein
VLKKPIEAAQNRGVWIVSTEIRDLENALGEKIGRLDEVRERYYRRLLYTVCAPAQRRSNSLMGADT